MIRKLVATWHACWRCGTPVGENESTCPGCGAGQAN